MNNTKKLCIVFLMLYVVFTILVSFTPTKRDDFVYYNSEHSLYRELCTNYGDCAYSYKKYTSDEKEKKCLEMFIYDKEKTINDYRSCVNL